MIWDFGFGAWDFRASVIGPKRSEFSKKLRPRAHRENIANDSADAGGRALEGLDRARVIVALDLERHRPAVADIDDARVFFAGFDQNVWPGGGKFFQLAPRILVGAVLAPHHRENAELGEIRLAPENLFDALEFVRHQTVFRDELGCDGGIGSGRHLLRTLADVISRSTHETLSRQSAEALSSSAMNRTVARSVQELMKQMNSDVYAR